MADARKLRGSRQGGEGGEWAEKKLLHGPLELFSFRAALETLRGLRTSQQAFKGRSRS